MNMKYKIRYRKVGSLFWKEDYVVGHGLDFIEEYIYNSNRQLVQVVRRTLDAMILYYEDGGIKRIPNWSQYEMVLGSDWKLAYKTKMEKESGAQIIMEN